MLYTARVDLVICFTRAGGRRPGGAAARPARPVVEVAAIDKVGFKPKTINVEPGTTVRWVNHGKEPHTVTSRDGHFDSGPLSPGGTFSVMFLRPGTYHYVCKPHEKMGMVGTVVVGAADKADKKAAVQTLKEVNRETRVHVRGNFLQGGPVVSPGVPP